MSFKIERGLFLLDFTDYHAILGVSVEADVKDIRKRYLKIARRLHPDSCGSESEEDKQRASQFLSKLVNPAWEKLSQDKDRTEYGILLKLQGQKGLRLQPPVELHSSLAKQLVTAGNAEHFYMNALKELAEQQYDHLDQTIELTSQISELNLAYLMNRERSGEPAKTTPSRPAPTTSTRSPATSAATNRAPAEPPLKTSPADQYYRRAEEHFGRNNYAQAVLELREGIQADAKHSRCHSLLGMVYYRQKQATMAKIHFNKALEIDPENEMAQQGKQMLAQAQAQTSPGKPAGKDAKATPAKTPPKGTKPNDKPEGGGLFGLFGKKK